MKKTKNITESQNINSIDIDTKNISDIVKIFNDDNKDIINGISNSLDDIKDVVDITLQSLLNGGRLFYVGAGTSGRLGVLDAAECKPTFSVDDDMVQGIIAGGEKALSESIEGAEDKIDGVDEIINIKRISSNDVVIGISCSGGAPFVLEFLKQSKAAKAETVLITFNDIEEEEYINKTLKVFVGPEIISGSTRMKSGTATKMILNMISTITMIKLNKTYGNYMVDLKVVNKKLLLRAVNIIKSLTGASSDEAEELVSRSKGKVKNALIMKKLGVSYLESIELIKKFDGSLRSIINEHAK